MERIDFLFQVETNFFYFILFFFRIETRIDNDRPFSVFQSDGGTSQFGRYRVHYLSLYFNTSQFNNILNLKLDYHNRCCSRYSNF